MKEVWKDCIYDSRYKISNHGRVRGVKGMLKPFLIRGYPTVSLSTRVKPRQWHVYRLVAEHFIGPPPTPKYECCHIDGNRENDRVDNLRWGTRQDNADDRVRHGNAPRGSNNVRAKLNEPQVRTIKAMRRTGNWTVVELGEMFGVCHTAISAIMTGKTWKHV